MVAAVAASIIETSTVVVEARGAAAGAGDVVEGVEAAVGEASTTRTSE